MIASQVFQPQDTLISNTSMGIVNKLLIIIIIIQNSLFRCQNNVNATIVNKYNNSFMNLLLFDILLSAIYNTTP